MSQVPGSRFRSYSPIGYWLQARTGYRFPAANQKGSTVNPKFDTFDLTDLAAAEIIGSPALRTSRERMPDVAGEFFQVQPAGAREIAVRGVLASAVKASADLAVADLKARLLAIQQHVGVVATYAGTDGRLYSGSLLSAYRQAGPMEVSAVESGVQALANVEAVVVAQP